MLRNILLAFFTLILLYFINLKFKSVEGAATMKESGQSTSSNCHYKAINKKMKSLNDRVQENTKNISQIMDQIGKLTQ